MSHNILITGGSGYLGGTLLARLGGANLPAYGRIYALVRTDEQAQAVKQYGVEPLYLDLKDEAAIHDAIVGNSITVVFYLIDAMNSGVQVNIIKALGDVRKSTGQEVHFLHVG
jgi:nucleoside-diphosphate-sugar epimerase